MYNGACIEILENNNVKINMFLFSKEDYIVQIRNTLKLSAEP